MAVDPIPSASRTTTPDPDRAARWSRWEQRGLDNDARLARRTHVVLAIFSVAGCASVIAALWFS